MAQPAEDRYLKQLGKMQRPIPGSSLTNNPEEPLPFEGAPQFTKKKDALEEIFGNMIRPEVYPSVMEALAQGSTIMELTQVLLFEGFRQGKWNPDVFLMLIEPTAYIIMALAERADIDYKVDNEVEDEDPTTEVDRKFDQLSKKIKKGKVKAGVIPKEIEKQIEELPEDNLLDADKVAPVVEVSEDSLLTEV
jgi:hypothetical protein